MLAFRLGVQDVWIVNLGFSPDGRHFLAGCRNSTMAFDLQQKREESFPGPIKNLIRGDFAFLGPDRIVGVDISSPQKSPVLRFPTGERLQELPLSSLTHLSSPGHGDYVLLWPLQQHDLGAMDINKREMFIAFPQKAGDIYDNPSVFERKDGEIALADNTAKKTLATVQITQARLGAASTVVVSDDLSRLAVSTSTRGAVWDITHNIRTHYVRNFHSGWFDPGQTFYADFPKQDKQERTLVRLDPYGGAAALSPIADSDFQIASSLISEKCAKENAFARKDCTLDLQDLTTKTTIWSRHFPKEAPLITFYPEAGRALLRWIVGEPAARDEMQQFPDLKGTADKEDYLLEAVDLHKNTVSGKLLVRTSKGSFTVRHAAMSGDWVALSVSGDRVLTYSLATGEAKGHVFGVDPILSAAAGEFAVSTSRNHVVVYELATSSLRDEFEFSAPVAYKKFSPDGKRLFILTRDQTAYILDLTLASASSQQP
jgi:hypothetical protein